MRRFRRTLSISRLRPRQTAIGAALFLGGCGLLQARAQTAPSPAGADSARPASAQLLQVQPDPSSKLLHDADDAYLRGAKALDRKDLLEADRLFARAHDLNPQNRDYAIALAVVREHRLTDLVQRAARAHQQGHDTEADQLLAQAREIDPQNAVVRQHFAPDGSLAAFPAGDTDQADTLRAGRAGDAATLGGAIELTPRAGVQSFHLRGSAHDLLSNVASAFGLRANITDSISTAPGLHLDIDNADFPNALRAVETLTHSFSVPLLPTELLFAKDNPELRAQYQPLIEETLYLPGTSQADLTEYANMARSVFNLRVVNAIANSGSLVLRGDEDTLSHVNATFADLVDGGADVLLDLTIYEVDRSHITNLGAQLPGSIGAFPVAATAQNLINANQSLISEAVANNLITLTGNAYTDALTELEFLLASGTVSSAQFTGLLGVFGHYAGLPLAGVFLGSSTTLNASLTSSDVRLLDTIQLRVGDKEDGQFRAGTRYPIETGIYSSSLSSGISSAVAGLSINGTSVSSLLSQYLGSSSVSVPQVQFEDLGLTLKATPRVERTGEVSLKLDLKIETLGSGAINTLPILNNRQLLSTVTIPRGQTAIIASAVSNSELRAIQGLPFLSEIPGFQSTNKSTEKDTSELVLTLTPHLVRNKNFHVTSRRLLLATGNSTQQP